MGQREDVRSALQGIAALPGAATAEVPQERRLTVGRLARRIERAAGGAPTGAVAVEKALEYFSFSPARTARARVAELDAEARARLRIALAFASAGQWLVLDEPFSGVSGQARAGIRGRLLEACSEFGRGLILATDSPVDAAVIGGTAVMLEKGQVADVGAFGDLLREPRSNLAAGMAGVNVFSGLARRNWLSIGHSKVRARTELDGKVYVTIPTNAAHLSFDEFDPTFTSDSVFEAVVVGIRDTRRTVQVVLSPADTEVGLAMTADLLDFTVDRATTAAGSGPTGAAGAVGAAGSEPAGVSEDEPPDAAATSGTAPEWGVLHPALGQTVGEQLSRVKVGARLYVEVDTARMHAYPIDRE
ncbi:hypothetical protein GCM10022261_11080 [Brevibacterium daeguense]|uniref:Uncharacterized protein n=1 Tax=Brevibacterium daeguense TaxID=909936 RepID=A0ABP8EI03_9MICO|nr:hypothetical protein [Brevibacterium daeguense]